MNRIRVTKYLVLRSISLSDDRGGPNNRCLRTFRWFFNFPSCRGRNCHHRGARRRPQCDRIDIILWIYREACPHCRHIDHCALFRRWNRNCRPFVIRNRRLLDSRGRFIGVRYELKGSR